MRETVDYGIDLGTTNSSIALYTDDGVRVFKNNDNSQSTPSAIWENKRQALYVGSRAKDKASTNPGDVMSEFKIQMGSSKEFIFQGSGRSMNPEELTAEVLKTLRADANRRMGEDIDSAVITIPAAFERPQIEATNKAANLAGLSNCPLCLEPVAAALAYGSQSNSKKGFWLIYDFGGGTFDVAVVKKHADGFDLVNHKGDNQLGGKLIDWDIVDKLLAEHIRKEYNLPDFKRGVKKWRVAFSKLKAEAEKAKIRLSQDNETDILIDELCILADGQSIDLDMAINKVDVDRITEPYIIRSLNLCKEVLAEEHLGFEKMEKIVLVGGPTQIPYFRERLGSLGVDLEYSVDPMTIVAQGASIFARTQLLKQNDSKKTQHLDKNLVSLNLEYKPVGIDQEFMIGGQVEMKGSVSGFTIEFTNISMEPTWRSGKLPISDKGKFIAELVAEKGKNVYKIELCDSTGKTKELATANEISYLWDEKIGAADDVEMLVHSIGIAQANNKVDFIFKKGDRLPIKNRTFHRQAIDVIKDSKDQGIRIPLVEGENEIADRNMPIGFLEIPSSDIKRNVPAGSEIQITVKIDKSGRISANTYIPILDEEYDDTLSLEKKTIAKDVLQNDIAEQKKRLREIREKTEANGNNNAEDAINRIEEESMLNDVEESIAVFEEDNNAADRAHSTLLKLKIQLDKAEASVEWPTLVEEAKTAISAADKVVKVYDGDRKKFSMLKREVQEAMQSFDKDLLRQKIDNLDSYKFDILHNEDSYWEGLFKDLHSYKHEMNDQEAAEKIFSDGSEHLYNENYHELRLAVRQLYKLLPYDEQNKIEGGYKGTTHQ